MPLKEIALLSIVTTRTIFWTIFKFIIRFFFLFKEKYKSDLRRELSVRFRIFSFFIFFFLQRTIIVRIYSQLLRCSTVIPSSVGELYFLLLLYLWQAHGNFRIRSLLRLISFAADTLQLRAVRWPSSSPSLLPFR